MEYNLRQEITSQALDEIDFSRQRRQGVIPDWNKNENLYYNKKYAVEEGQINVNLNEMQSFVSTYLSKINSPYNFQYIKGENADYEKALIVNAIKEKDRKNGLWDAKLLFARVQMILYGRYIFEYHADSIDKMYASHLTPVDVYQFLIDPTCGGFDIEQAFYLGRGNILKTKKQLQEWVKSGRYLRTEVEQLIKWSGNTEVQTQEDIAAENRYINITGGNREIGQKDVWKFWEWNTTFKGERYTLLVTENGGKAVSIQKHKDLFPSDKWQYFSCAAMPDLTEFWSPAPATGVREAIMAKQVSVNQALQNSEEINNPITYFDVEAVEDPEIIQYRGTRNVPFKWGVDINKAVQVRNIPSISTPFAVYDKLDQIIAVASGVTNAARWQAEEDKVGIYEGNVKEAADRFAIVGDLEAHAQYRFATLWLEWLDEHLTNKMAVDIIGIDGVWYKKTVSKKDLKRDYDFDITIITSGQEQAMQGVEKRNKLTFLTNNKGNPTINPKTATEYEATIAGFNPDEVAQLLDVKDYANAKLMAEAERDIQQLLKGKKVEPNASANTAYSQKIIDYARDNKENIDLETFGKIMAYVDSLQPIIMTNMNRDIDEQLWAEWLPSQPGQAIGMEWQAPVPGMELPEPALANPAEPVEY